MEEQLAKYKSFFEQFLSLVNPADQLPVRITVCNIKKVEVVGAVIDWILQYLISWKCPGSLITPLAKVILDEVKPILKTVQCPYYSQELEVYSSLPLMQYVISKIQEIFPRYLEDEQILSLSISNYKHYISVFATKNRRRCMEDSYVIIYDLQKLFDVQDIGNVNYYAIFDGHNGNGAAMYSSAHLHQFLAENPFYPVHPEQALCEAFKATDKHLLEKEDSQIAKSGTTAICILWHQTQKMLYSAWVGDSEAILAKKGHVFRLVEPHRADRQDEQDRINKMGGVVLFWGKMWRVNGQLAISRAIGDSEHKSCIISTPDVGSVQLEGDEDFVILACDGLWDCVGYDEAAHVVYKHVTSSPDNSDQVSQLLVQLAKSKGSEDNITVIVVYLIDPHHIKLSSADMETATAESFSPKQNGANYCSISDIQGNFDHVVNDDDDFGPETNVDNIDDGLISQPVSTKKSFTSFDTLNSNACEQETRTKSETEIKETKETENLENDKNVLSDESDEEEWNYFKGEGNTNSKPNNCKNSQQPLAINVSSSEMDYTLNPDAAEFVPLSPTNSKKEDFDLDEPVLCNLTPEVRERLLQDEIVASSPLRGQEKSMDDLDLPSLSVFDSEIRKRPSNILPTSELDVLDTDVAAAKNDEFQLPLDGSFEFNSHDSSTTAMIGDDSSFVKNMEDVSSNCSKDKLDDTHEKEMIHPDTTTDSQARTIVENGMFDDEDFPSINNRPEYNFNESLNGPSEKSSFKNFSLNDTPNALHSMASFDDGAPTHSLIFSGDQTVLKPNSKSQSPVDELLEEIKFDENASVFMKFGGSSNPFSSIPNETDSTFSAPTNVPVFDMTSEKESEEEKEILDFNKSEPADVIDFMNKGVTPEVQKNDCSDEFLDFVQKKQLSDDSFLNSAANSARTDRLYDVEEDLCVADANQRDVEMNPESLKDKPVTAASHENVSAVLETEKMKSNNAVDIDEIERSLSSQIETTGNFEPQKFSAETVDRLEDVTVLSDAGSLDEPIRSVDMEAPYIHDCTRLDQKSDSVHHHRTLVKHYDDLLPDISSTIESDKLELELRESEVKSDFDKRSVEDESHNDVSFGAVEPTRLETKDEGVISCSQFDDQITLNETKEISDTPVVERRKDSNDDQSNHLLAVAATAAAGVTAAVALKSTVSNELKETKSSTIKKSSIEENVKSPLKTSKATSAMSKTMKSNPTSTRLSSEPKKPSTTVATANKVMSPRTGATGSRAAVPKTTTLTSRAPVAAKPSAVAKDKATARPPVKVSSPTKPKILASQTTKPLTKPELSNGNVSSLKLTATKKLSSTVGAMRKSTTSSETSGSTKPAVNLSTRTSLAPKPRTTTTTTSVEKSKLSTSLTAKQPASAPVKVTNKDTKDITNKRLLATKSSPVKMSSSATSKTESKVNSGLKGNKLKAVSSTVSSTKKPVSVVNANQSEVAQHQN